MSVAKVVRNSAFARGLTALPAALGLLVAVFTWTGTAEAAFTCQNNADCYDTAHQCDCGPNPCNDGVCSPGHPDANAIGCILVPNDSYCDDGNFCNGPETCDMRKGCQVGIPPTCDDDVLCTEDTCDIVADECVSTPRNSRCGNGLFCDGRETCDPEIGCIPGDAPNCNDGIACTIDTCNETTNECDNIDNDAACSNGIFCDGVEQCTFDGCGPGTPVNCNDGVACTVDSCNEASDSCNNNPNDAACSNGQFCDGVETCHRTQGCRPGTPPNCNNGDFCDGVEVCANNACQPGTPPNCSDGVGCTTDTCVEATDSCAHTPNNANCSNGSFCDGVETCSPTQGCRPGTAPNCNDGIPCTGDSCDEANDVCAHVPNHGQCGNGQFCDGSEVCDPSKGCQPGAPVNCNDGVSCTIDRCLEAFDRCDHFDNDDACNNDQYCDGVETCDPLLDCQDGTPVSCDDNIECTIDTCIESSNSCRHLENPAVCSNGLFCDGAERCDALLGCYFGLPPSCSDNVDCTIDTCIEETDSCEHESSDDLCSNGSFCDGTEQCVPELGGCIDGGVPDCDDGIDCTVDSCSDQAGSCLNDPDSTVCDNDTFCDGSEVCVPGNGCVPGPPPTCNDNLTCTDDSCSEPAEMCLFEPNNLLCGNGIVDPGCGEECDEDNGEICNNDIDDDGDTLVDCADPDCLESQVLETCDDQCRLVPPCRPLQRDPAIISWGGPERAAGAPGAYSFHARLMPTTPIDPLTEGFTLTLSNANGEIYRAELDAADFKWTRTSYVYRNPDPGSAAINGGVIRLGVRKRLYAGKLGYGLRFKAYGDFTRATLATMTTQVYFGDDVGYVTATYGGEPGYWILRPRDYDDGLP